MKHVISASRRTDLPRWFLDDVIVWFNKGEVLVKNPFNKYTHVVDLKPENVHSIVWWSKDFGRFLKKRHHFKAYNQYFHFTINGYTRPSHQFLEPGMTTPLVERLDQVKQLADIYGPETINWRFDPIVFWFDKDGRLQNNVLDYEVIARKIAETGVTRNTISFATWYGKCERRAKKHGFKYHEPDRSTRLDVASEISKLAKELGLKVHACANDDIVSTGIIQKASCIDGNLLNKIFGEGASIARDTGQREMCGCTKSKDIGGYEMVCKHGCIYCYANPRI
nr:DUF1848 family protein [Candidatus Sigynarchaeota archaeon]